MVDIARREDALLEKIHDLRTKRDNTIRTIEGLAESSPELAEVMDFILVGLR